MRRPLAAALLIPVTCFCAYAQTLAPVAVTAAPQPPAAQTPAAQTTPAQTTPAQTTPDVAHESLLIGPGDLLQITVLDESDLSRKVRVRDSGEVNLPFIGNVHVGGLNTSEASAAVASKYIEGQFL